MSQFYSFEFVTFIWGLQLLGLAPSYGAHVVYNRNHYFGLGPVPILKTKLADTLINTETTLQRENLVTDSMG